MPAFFVYFGMRKALPRYFGAARPHPALRATFSRRERVIYSLLPPGEGPGMRARVFTT
jgi:hypothetical protein